VYADIYYVPLGLSVLLLVLEVLLGEAPPRRFVRRTPPPRRPRLGLRPPGPAAASLGARVASSGAVWLVLGMAALVGALTSASTGCSGWEPTEPFERNAPEVDEAIRLIDAGQYESAEKVLADYLGTGLCSDAGLGLPPTVRSRPDGAFDLGLTLFYLGEKFGQRFGEQALADEGPEAAQLAARRSLEIDCAQIVVKAIAGDPKVLPELRARAYYLSGNLEFLRGEYQAAVDQYDAALAIVPGIWPEAGDGDGIGRDAAWNRAIALRRIEEQEQDAGQDGGQDGPDDADAETPDAQPDGSDDAGEEDGGDGGDGDGGPDSGAPDAGNEDGGEQGPSDGGAQDGGDEGAEDASAPPPQPEEEPQPQERPAEGEDAQRERILDELEQAPTYQQEEARKRAGVRPRYRMEDK
jgi:tetratricopeptide (TPR) repeat protein